MQSDGYYFSPEGNGIYTEPEPYSYPAKNTLIAKATLSLVGIHHAA